jgi:hypothetical protein
VSRFVVADALNRRRWQNTNYPGRLRCPCRGHGEPAHARVSGFHACLRWKLRPRQVTGDRTDGTEENSGALETQHIRIYVALPDNDHRTEFLSLDRFRYEAERDIYLGPAGKELHLDRPHSTERSLCYRTRAKGCNHCPLKPECTTSKQGRTLCRSVDEEYLDRVRGYYETEDYKKRIANARSGSNPSSRRGKTGMAFDAFACDGSGALTVRRSCEPLGKISSACSKSGAGDAVHTQQRPCVPSFWLRGGG